MRIEKRKFISKLKGGLLATALLAIAPHGFALTLDQAVRHALANNLDLQAAYYNVEQARGRLLQAGLWPNPALEFSATTDRTFNNEGEQTGDAGFRQAFPVSGRLKFARQVGRVDVAQAMAEIRNRERLLIGEVQRDFMTAMLLKQQIATNREFMGINREFVEAMEQRFKKAEISEVDVGLARVEAQRFEMETAALEADLSAREISLKQRLGIAPETPLVLEGNIDALALKFGPEKYRTATGMNRPDLRLTELGVDRAAAEMRLARAEAWQDWTLGFDYANERRVDDPTGLRTDQFVGLKISIPLALWNRNQGRIHEQQAAAEQARKQIEALELAIHAEIATGLARANKLREVVRNYQSKLLPSLGATASLLSKGYAEGLVNVTQVVQAQQQRAMLRTAYLGAYATYVGALVDLETATASSPFLKRDFLQTEPAGSRRKSNYRK